MKDLIKGWFGVRMKRWKDEWMNRWMDELMSYWKDDKHNKMNSIKLSNIFNA